MYRLLVKLITLIGASCALAMLSGCPSSGSGNDTVINGAVSTGGSSPPQAIGNATVVIYQVQAGVLSVLTQTVCVSTLKTPACT